MPSNHLNILQMDHIVCVESPSIQRNANASIFHCLQDMVLIPDHHWHASSSMGWHEVRRKTKIIIIWFLHYLLFKALNSILAPGLHLRTLLWLSKADMHDLEGFDSYQKLWCELMRFLIWKTSMLKYQLTVLSDNGALESMSRMNKGILTQFSFLLVYSKVELSLPACVDPLLLITSEIFVLHAVIRIFQNLM